MTSIIECDVDTLSVLSSMYRTAYIVTGMGAWLLAYWEEGEHGPCPNAWDHRKGAQPDDACRWTCDGQ